MTTTGKKYSRDQALSLANAAATLLANHNQGAMLSVESAVKQAEELERAAEALEE